MITDIYLSIINHMNTLIDDIFRMFAHKFQNVFDECLIR